MILPFIDDGEGNEWSTALLFPHSFVVRDFEPVENAACDDPQGHRFTGPILSIHEPGVPEQ